VEQKINFIFSSDELLPTVQKLDSGDSSIQLMIRVARICRVQFTYRQKWGKFTEIWIFCISIYQLAILLVMEQG
jgi:hypothetical protein